MTSLNRVFLIALILQIGCLALDHPISELEYEEDELRLLVGGSYPSDPIHISDSSSADNEFESDVVSFHPSAYDFHESPVGMARLGIVRIDNRLKSETVKLISISGNTVNFHSSFFADKVKGVGLPNPYRLRPLVGAKIPVNASYEPIITLHNPHDTRILVVEMLSSGTDFSLKLPDDMGDQEQGTAWAIEPFQTKSVMQGSFQGKIEGNHTGFIRIKVNHTTISGEYLMVPVEVQVSSSPGIYCPQESLDFGLLVRTDKPKTLSLILINAQPNPVNIQSVTVKGESNHAIRIEFRPVFIEPDSSASTVIALITFDPSLLDNPSQSNGFIEVRSECEKSIKIPFIASVLEGELEYNSSSLGFFDKGENSQPRNFSIKNTFSSAVAIYQITVNYPDIIEVETFNQSHVIIPGEQKTICTLKVQKKFELCDSKSPVQLTVKSNITNLKLPITCYDGKLQLFSVESGKLDFGRVELYSTYTEYIAVQNKNPVEVRLKSWGSNSSFSQVELVGMQKGVMEDLPRIRDFDNLKKSLFLQPGHMAVFSVDIRRPTVEGMFYGESYVITDQNQTLRSPFKFTVSRGSLSSETIFFDKAFPGKISFEKLYLSSTFNHTLKFVGLRSHPPSAVWFSASTLQNHPEIPPEPHRKSLVGKVHFDPRKFCNQECYAGFSLESKFGKDWMRGAILNWETGEIDLRILETLQARFNQIKDEIVSNMSLWVDTNGPSGFKIKAQTRYMWPRVSTQKTILFPLTSLGNETFVDVVISNPSNVPVVFQAAMAEGYGPSWTNFLHDNFVGGNITEGGSAFSVKDVSWPSSQFNGSGIVDVKKIFQKHNPEFKELMPGLLFILPPTSKLALTIRFAPVSKEMANSLLLLRNNLTGIEVVMLKGRAGTGQLTVGNGTPGSSLMFQLTEGLLQGCDKEVDSALSYISPQITVRRSFVARNIGEIPLEVTKMMIYPPQVSLWTWVMGWTSYDGDACEGYGFRILNCHPFLLQPNQTHSIDIAFTPDFTLSKVLSALLLIDTVGNAFNYTLVALIPTNMLAKCASAIPRPWWEWYLKATVIGGGSTMILMGCFLGYFEARKVIANTVLATVRVLPREPPDDIPVPEEREQPQRLDLKAVYDKVENRFRKNQADAQKGLPSTQSKSQTNIKLGELSQAPSIRNRKGKKAGNDLNVASQTATTNNRLTDKTNHNIVVQRISTNIVEEVAATYMNLGTKKENNVNKKKKGNKGQQQVNGKVNKKMQNKIDTFNPVVQGKKTEEETSSTTTESSNPDDIVQYSEAEPKITEKTANTKGAKVKNAKRVEKNNESSSNENISNISESFTDRSHDAKKVYTKKKDSASDYSATSSYQSKSGNSTPKPEIGSLWDTPRPPSGEGLSELAAQTEVFVLQRPKKRTVSGGDGTGLAVDGNFMNVNNPRNSMSYFQTHPIPSYGSNSQQRGSSSSRKPAGVIGQPRSAGLPHGNFGSHSHSMSSTLPPNPDYNYQQTHYPHNIVPPRAPAIAPNSSIWDNDIHTGNADMWSRRSIDTPPASTNYYNSPHENKFTQQPNMGFSSDAPYGYNINNSASSGLPFCPTTSENHFAYTPPTRMSQTINYSSASGNGMIPGSDVSKNFEQQRSPAESSYLFANTGVFANNTNNNRNQISPPSFNETSTQYRSHQGYVNQIPPITTHSNHGYLQRMRSDPTIRSHSQQPSPPSSTRPPWIGAVFADNELKRRETEERERNTWLPTAQPPPLQPTSVASTDPPGYHQDWKGLGAAGPLTIESQIWDSSNVGGPGRWPSAYDTPTTIAQTASVNKSMAIGPAARLRLSATARDDSNIPIGDGSIRTPTEDITREVEAGLGFNPFTSNIWNNNQSESTSSSSWGSYSYSQKK
ncbi:hypothetical protein Fcan01_12442 [Folsomia candida]|uniref:Transmembrane protein 131 n=1 Tax=Folsomia candida TaxID=158441 RepID=A0A226E5I2_FOLCA|nr:hypothetical protein Fcan01_12442 [Folsomia candida]